MAVAKQKIRFHFLKNDFTLRNRTSLKSFILRLCKKEGRVIENINYIFCSDSYLLQINQEYLHHDTYTDIVTFELSSAKAPLIADIYISIDRVKENAKAFGSGFSTELLRVMLHGALHLSGYKDKSAKQSKLMRSKEDYYLNLYRST
jgi:rRNA maturation RNase YbeY